MQLQNFAIQADKSKALNIGKALFCLELQHRNALTYETFLTAQRTMQDYINAFNTQLNDSPKWDGQNQVRCAFLSRSEIMFSSSGAIHGVALRSWRSN
jgi:hypothetical protein